MRYAAVDTDFIFHIADVHMSDDEIIEAMKKTFHGIEREGVIHELLYENEIAFSGGIMKVSGFVKKLFEEGVLKKMPLSEIISDHAKKEYYENVFVELFREIGGDLPVADIFKEWKSQCSLGETHTVTMCAVIDADIVLSDDNDAKMLGYLLQKKFAKSITVFNRNELFMKPEMVAVIDLNRKQRKALAHQRT